MNKKNTARINPVNIFSAPKNNTSNVGRLLDMETPDKEIIAVVNDNYTWYMNASRDTRRQWLVNSAFTRGQQWSILHRNEDRLVNLAAPPGRKQIMVDKIGTWKEHTVANIVSAVPMFQAQPTNNDTGSVASARAASSLLTYYWDDWRFDVQKIQMAGYMVDFGNAFVFLNYIEGNKFVIDPVYDLDGNAALDENGDPVSEKHAIGDIEPAVLMPHYVGLPLDDSPVEDKPWIEIFPTKSLSHFINTYKDGYLVMAENLEANNNFNIERISEANRSKRGTLQTQQAIEKIYMQKPCKSKPDGFMAVVANGVLLMKSEWPYKKLATYPIEHFHYPKEPGEFFARSRVEKQIPIQKFINIIHSSIGENADAFLNIKWMNPNNSGVTRITNDNEMINYNYPYKPEMNTITPLPAWVMDEMQQLYSDMQDVQSYHGASMGASQSGVRSQSHAQDLQDQDMMPINVLDMIVGASYERMGEKILYIAAEKLTEERIITYVGEDKRNMVKKFKASMLGDIKKVKVRLDNTWLRNKAAVTNNIMQMGQYGLILDTYGQPDTGKIMKLMEFALPDGVFSDMKIHTDLAYHENDMMMQSITMPVVQWQNHNLHLGCHQDFMNSPEFMNIVMEYETKPESKATVDLFVSHTQQHSKLFGQAMGMIQPKQTQGSQASQETAPKGSKSSQAVSK
jgi:hypothetical protein